MTRKEKTGEMTAFTLTDGTRYVKESAVEQAVVAERERIRKAIHDLPTWPNERADDEWENPFVKMEDVVALFPVEVSG